MTAPNLVDGYLTLVRQALKPADVVRERVEARLAAQPYAGTPIELSSGAAPRTLSVSVATAGGTVLVVLGFVVGYLLRGAELTRRSEASASRPTLHTIAPGASPTMIPEPPAPLLALEPAHAQDAERTARPREPSSAPRGQITPRAATAPISPKIASSQDEMLLLQRAERAVRAENAALALMLVAELDARHPRSEWIEERRAIELMAHCVGRATDSKARADRFLSTHPRSVYTERINLLCQLEPSSTEPL